MNRSDAENAEHRFGDLLDGDAVHAAEINGALPEETRRAFDGCLDDFGMLAEWAGEFGGGGTEDRHQWRADGGGQMHRAGIVGQEEPAKTEEFAEFEQAGLAGDVDDVEAAHGVFNLAGNLGVTGAAEQEPPAIHFLRNTARDFGEALCRPAFGGAELCAGIDADEGAAIVTQIF